MNFESLQIEEITIESLIRKKYMKKMMRNGEFLSSIYNYGYLLCMFLPSLILLRFLRNLPLGILLGMASELNILPLFM